MSHYAKIENSIVADVIAADQKYIDGKSGDWIQVSYNTQNGVHYGKNGRPDGKTALRFNYPSIGDIYDKSRDVFYRPKPADNFTLDQDTLQWVENPK
jgi:hypothetical protein